MSLTTKISGGEKIMSLKVPFGVVLAALAAFGPAGRAVAQQGRQDYSAWAWQANKQRYACTYYYKPNPQAAGYNYHYVYYYPKYGRWAYYYNPGFGGKKGYWGRCGMDGGANPYQYLYTTPQAAQQRNPQDRTNFDVAPDQIPSGNFGQGEPMPFIPQTQGPDRMSAPPNLAAGAGGAP
jgi:hypothetical protein